MRCEPDLKWAEGGAACWCARLAGVRRLKDARWSPVITFGIGAHCFATKVEAAREYNTHAQAAGEPKSLLNLIPDIIRARPARGLSLVQIFCFFVDGGGRGDEEGACSQRLRALVRNRLLVWLACSRLCLCVT